MRQDELPPGEAWLTEAEREVLSRLRFPKRRGDWLLGRWAAKRAFVLAGEAETEAGVAILAAPSGAPEAFVGGRRASVCLSLTHSHGVAVAALGPPGEPLGIDLERVEERRAAFLSDWFTRGEQEFVSAAEAGTAGLAATLVWSAKESVMKALREGLRIPPKSVDVKPERGAPDGAWRRFVAHGPGEASWRGWWRADAVFVLCAVSGPDSVSPRPIG